jgi:hypothetical protein
MRPICLLASSVALACAPAPDGKPGDAAPPHPTLAPPAPEDGFQVSMFGTAPAYSEVWLCEVYNLPTAATAHVNEVVYLENPGTHHMTLSTTALSQTAIPPGTYDCNDLYADTTLMEDIVMMFGSQGEAEGRLQLPAGIAASLPPGIQVLHEVHYVNSTDAEVPIYSYINALTIPEDEVVGGVWGGSVRDEDISIPAESAHTEWSTCVMNEDVEVLFLASHMHARGRSFTIAPYDGAATGEVFYENTDWHDPMITQMSPAIPVRAGEGFTFACTWDNADPEGVAYGLTADDEMCNMAVVFTPFSVTAACEVVASGVGAPE